MNATGHTGNTGIAGLRAAVELGAGRRSVSLRANSRQSNVRWIVRCAPAGRSAGRGVARDVTSELSAVFFWEPCKKTKVEKEINNFTHAHPSPPLFSLADNVLVHVDDDVVNHRLKSASTLAVTEAARAPY